jgi:hypothetical protein
MEAGEGSQMKEEKDKMNGRKDERNIYKKDIKLQA